MNIIKKNFIKEKLFCVHKRIEWYDDAKVTMQCCIFDSKEKALNFINDGIEYIRKEISKDYSIDIEDVCFKTYEYENLTEFILNCESLDDLIIYSLSILNLNEANLASVF